MPSDQCSETVTVPRTCRPRFGNNPVPLDEACERGEQALQAAAVDFSHCLLDMIGKMIEAGDAGSDCFDELGLLSLMNRANDVRGVAASLGAGLTADVADTIFVVAERAIGNGRLSRQLVNLLAQTSLRVSRYDPQSDGGEMAVRIQDMLRGVRESAAA